MFLYVNALNKLSLILNLQMASNTTSQMKCSYKDCGEAIEPESNRADVRGFNVPKSDRKGIILYHIHVHRILFCLKLSIFTYFKESLNFQYGQYFVTALKLHLYGLCKLAMFRRQYWSQYLVWVNGKYLFFRTGVYVHCLMTILPCLALEINRNYF